MGDEYKAIRLLDLVLYERLGFDIYIHLPLNGKYIRYIGAEDSISEDMLLRLRARSLMELFIRETDLERYRAYIGSSLTSKLKDQSLSSEERATLIRKSAGNSLSTIDQLSSEKDIVAWTNACIETTNAMIQHFVGASMQETQELLKHYMADGTTLEKHSLLVSSLGVILGMALGFHEEKTLFELAIGGLLHDAGLSRCSEETREGYLANKPLRPDQESELKTHPVEGVGIITKILCVAAISDNVLRIVHDHHENATASGYPNKVPLIKLSPLVKTIAIADRAALELIHSGETNVRMILLEILKKQRAENIREFDEKVIEQVLMSLGDHNA